jgi:hypothetical protein
VTVRWTPFLDNVAASHGRPVARGIYRLPSSVLPAHQVRILLGVPLISGNTTPCKIRANLELFRTDWMLTPFAFRKMGILSMNAVDATGLRSDLLLGGDGHQSLR